MKNNNVKAIKKSKNNTGVRCLIQGHPDGYGFALAVDDNKQILKSDKSETHKDLFLDTDEMRTVLHGDMALVSVKRVNADGKIEGKIVEVISRACTEVVASVHHYQGQYFAVAKDLRISQDILLPPCSYASGDVVVVRITQYPSAEMEMRGEIIRHLGSKDDSGIEIEIALRQFDLPHEFSTEVQSEADKLPSKVRTADLKNRSDMRHLALVTIDGETAKDFDDAVYAEKRGADYLLIVAIADVGHYVKIGSAIDTAARERATSVYFPRRVIPMLPEALSNEMCSLKPEVDRLCLACEILISPFGQVKSYRFINAVMHSQARLTYTQAWNFLSSPKKKNVLINAEVSKNLRTLYALYEVLREAREQRGAIDFDSPEVELHFSETGKIESVSPSVRNEAHKLIEECMLLANVCAAEFLEQNQAPSLYRNHQGPSPDRLENLRQFLNTLGLHLGGGESPSPMDYAVLSAAATDRPERQLIQTMLLRSMQQANYEADNKGHFGLAFDAYTHFTSPIRRYPDLVVHRAIRALISHKSQPKEDLKSLGKLCSNNERRADEASRAVLSYLKCVYLAQHLGETFNGRVSGVTAFGAFVTLEESGIDGLIHISTLPRDYYEYQANRQRLVGKRTGRSLQLSQEIRVKVAAANPDTLKIDFEWLP